MTSMPETSKPLSLAQLFFMIIQILIGITIFVVPYNSNLYAHHNAWLSAIILLIVFQLLGLIIITLHNRFPNQNLFQIAEITMGKAVGKVLSIILVIYHLFSAAYGCIYFAYLSMEWTLPLTPNPVVYLLLLLPAFYMATSKLTAFARFCCIAFILIVGLVFSSCFAISEMNFSFLLPVGDVPFSNILKGAINIGPVYNGINCLLIYLPKVRGESKTKRQVVLYAILTASLIYVFSVVVCLAYFGTKGLDVIMMPLLYLLKTVTIFGVLERLDLLLISAWLIPSATSFVVNIHMALTGTKQVIGKKKDWKLLGIFFVAIYAICIVFPLSQYNVYLAGEYLLPLAYVFMFGVSPLLLIVSMIRKINLSR